jgi:hypothetical protein
MILLAAILAGLVGGLFLAWVQNRSWSAPQIQKPWLAIIAFIPQFFGIYLPKTRVWLPDEVSAAGLIVSLGLLLVFCWFNRRLPGVWLLALGLFFNLLVIATNGGFMPISPQTASHLVPSDSLTAIGNGGRFGYKDILLIPEQTHLIWLSDHFLTPKWFPYQVAFSIGDMLIAAGAFWLMVNQSKPLEVPKNRANTMAKENEC